LLQHAEVTPVRFSEPTPVEHPEGTPVKCALPLLNTPQLNKSTKAFNGVNLALTSSPN